MTDHGEAARQVFLFADLAGFTALTEAHGDEEATAMAEDFTAAVRRSLPQFGAELIKTIGDEVMIRLESPDQAVELGLRIVTDRARPGLPPVRVGIHCGPALRRNGDWFGSTVNVASRVTRAARPGEVLLTDATREGIAGDGFELEGLGLRQFRHVYEAIPVYRAIGVGGAGRHLEIDLVCRMAVDPTAAAVQERRRGITYYFCSPECAQAFRATPRRYLGTSLGARAARRGFLINSGAFAVAALAHGIDWLIDPNAGGHDRTMFFAVASIWAIALVFHYRAVRVVL